MWCVWNGNNPFSSSLGCQNGLQLCFSEYPIFTASDKVPKQQNSRMPQLLIQNDYLICYLPLCSSPISSFCTLSVVPRRVVIFANDDHKREVGNENMATPFTRYTEGTRKWKFHLTIVQKKCVSMEVAQGYIGLLFLRLYKEIFLCRWYFTICLRLWGKCISATVSLNMKPQKAQKMMRQYQILSFISIVTHWFKCRECGGEADPHRVFWSAL